MTDALGYRSGGGVETAAPSEKTVSKFVTNKPALLNSPGFMMTDLYYDTLNASVRTVEQQAYEGKDRIQLSGKFFGQQQNAYVPSVYFVGNLFLRILLNGANLIWPTPAEGAEGSLFCLEGAWGYSLIATLTYYLGSSSVGNVTMQGFTNLALALESCDTAEKRAVMLHAGGKFLCARPTPPPYGSFGIAGGDALSTTIASAAPGQKVMRRSGNLDPVTQNMRNVVDNRLYSALVALRAPWASLGALYTRLPFDTTLLNQPMNFQIAFGQLPIRYSADFLAAPATSVPMLAFQEEAAEMTLQMEQFELTDKSMSVRNELLAQPDYNVCLPFQYTQSMTFPCKYQAPGDDESLTILSAKGKAVNITSFMNSDLTTVILGVREQVNVLPQGNKCDFLELQDVVLMLNGTDFTVYESDNYNAMQTAKRLGGAEVNHVVMSRAAEPPPFPSLPEAYNAITALPLIEKPLGLYAIDMSARRALANESHLLNTPRFTNMTFQVAFNIPKYLYSSVTNLVPSQSYDFTLCTTYCYNAVFEIGGSGGTSKLYTA